MDNIILENDYIKVEINPDDGGRITGIFDKKTRVQLLWNEERTQNTHRYFGCSYDDLTAGGVEECFPSVDPCVYKGRNIPHFGEIWTLKWDAEYDRYSCKLTVFSPIWPGKITKNISITETGKTVTVKYTIENVCLIKNEFVFGFHPALTLFEDSILELPKVRYQMLVGPSVEDADNTFEWPMYGTKDMSKPEKDGSGNVYNFLTVEVKEGKYSLKHPSKHTGITIEYDKDFFKCLSIWPVYGSWRGNYVILTEAFTSWGVKLDECVSQGIAVELNGKEEISTEVKYTVGE